MGLRNASVRLPNVVVMAPALTETAQPRNIKLNPNSDLAGLSVPTKKLRSLKDIVPLSLRDAKPDVCDPLYPDGMNGHSPSKITYSINGFTQPLKNEFVPIEKFSPCSISNEHVDSGDTGKQIVNCNTGDGDVTQVAGFVMSNSGNSMGDSSENMGVERPSNVDLTGLTDPEAVCPNREKLYQVGEVMDQLLNLVDKPEEMFESGELGHNVDDILQVFIDGNSAPDLPALGPTPSDGESMFPIPSNDIDGSLTSLERELFNGENMMNMCVDDGLVIMNKEIVIKDRLEEARKKQFQLKRKCEFLRRRLKKIQTRTLGRHVCDEITGMLEYTNNIYETVTRANKNGEVGAESQCDVKGVSLSTLSLLMRQMEHSAAQQANYLAKSNARNKYFGAGSSNANASNGMRLPGTIIPSFPEEVKEEASLVTGELQAQLSMLQEEIDSDLTASSSGCDSTDELDAYNTPPSLPYSSTTLLHQQPQIPLNRRALWRYSVERCLLAGRWAWLQARILDLDYRIGQTGELRRKLRITKGAVRLGAPSNPPSSSTSTSHPAGTAPTNPSSPAELVGCARTLPVAEGFRKRRIVRAEGLHLRSKRAGRATSVRCDCRGPPPCLLCTGRPDPTTPTDPTENLPVSSRVGLLDPAFHPNISFPSEVSESIHYAAIMKCGDWQSRAWRARGVTVGRVPSVGSSPIISVGAAREAVATLDDVRRPRISSTPPDDFTPSTPQSSSTLSSSSSIRKKNSRGRRRRIPLDGFKVIKPRKISVGVNEVGRPTSSASASNAVPSTSSGTPSSTAVSTALSEQDSVFNGGSDKYASPVPSPTPSKDQFRRKRENSYDIDNIVIPYCMAASTRPERLLYKEILTPKWRLVMDEKSESVTGKNGAVRRPSHDLEGEEDCSDETVTARHERCEIEERKKFLSYTRINRPGGRGQRRTDSRADSRADSTGPSTPLCMGEPMSPRESGNSMDSGEGASKSPRASPPPPSTSETMTGLPIATSTRRRTVSGSSMPAAPFSSLTPRSPPPPPPPHHLSEDSYYEPRLFPLPDEVFEKMLQEQRESQEYPPEEERPLRYSSEYGVLLDSSEDEV